MAEFMNRHPGGYNWKSRAEKDFLPFMEKLPDSWLFWHEPVIHKGYTPDFALWMSEPAHPALLLIELKTGRTITS